MLQALELAEQNFIAVFMRISLSLTRFFASYNNTIHGEAGCGIVSNCPTECGIGAIGHRGDRVPLPDIARFNALSRWHDDC